MNRYKTHRPVDHQDYIQGTRDARMSVLEGTQVDCPHHTDSGRAYRWYLGYSDELHYMACHMYNEKKYPTCIESRVRGATSIPPIRKSDTVYSSFTFARR